MSEESDRKIDPEGAIPPLAQRRGMPSAAAGEVENRPGLGPLRAEVALDKIQVATRLAGVPVGVELEIFLAEPLFVPSHGEIISDPEGEASSRPVGGVSRGAFQERLPPLAGLASRALKRRSKGSSRLASLFSQPLKSATSRSLSWASPETGFLRLSKR